MLSSVRIQCASLEGKFNLNRIRDSCYYTLWSDVLKKGKKCIRRTKRMREISCVFYFCVCAGSLNVEMGNLHTMYTYIVGFVMNDENDAMHESHIGE